jgi:hypothetical protein
MDTLATGVTAIFAVLTAGVSFIINDIFIGIIIGQLYTQPIVWVGTAIGVGIALLHKFKKPLA